MHQRPKDAPPGLVTVAIVIWFLLAALCLVIGLLLVLSIGMDKPGPTLFGLVGAVVFTIEARMVGVALRQDILWSGVGSLAFAALWWLIGSGAARGFAYVPPALMIVSGVAALASRDAYARWRRGDGPNQGSEVSETPPG